MLWSTGISAAGAEAAVSQISVLPSELYAAGLRDAFRDPVPGQCLVCRLVSVFRDLEGAADRTGGGGYADRPSPACLLAADQGGGGARLGLAGRPPMPLARSRRRVCCSVRGALSP
jgi:hypothetical protein